jgi:tetratricopeptide (TPR) repeat protein
MPASRNRNSKRTGPRPRRRWIARGAFIVAAVLIVVFLAPWSALQLARSALARRDPETALLWLQRASWFGQYRGEISFLQARSLRRLGRTDEFRIALESAAKSGCPTERLAREQTLLMAQMGLLRDIEADIPRILQTAGDDAAEACEAYVNGLLLNFRQVEALKVIESWSQDYPADPHPELIRGQIQQNSGKFADAEAAYRRALQLQPHSRDIQQRLADLLLQSKKIDAALELFRPLTADPQRRDAAWLQIAKCERVRGDIAAAHEALQQIQDRGRLSQGELALQEGLVALAREDYSAAATELERARDANPKSVEARHALAQALRGCGRNAEAAVESQQVAAAQAELSRADHLHDLVASDPLDPRPRLEIGKILIQYGDAVRGVIWVQSALNLQPDLREANQALAEYYEGQAKTAPQYSALAEQYRARAGESR